MASWMVHLRVADKLLSRFPSLIPTEFTVGNIAPDSGLPNEDGTTYTPDKDGSHFRTRGEDGHRHPDPSLFASLYLTPEQLTRYTAKERSFYLGYYVHLLTDVEWTQSIFIPIAEQFREEYEKDPTGFINGPLKRDWYDLDYLYLKEHPSFRAWEIYKAAEGFDNTYIDRFARHAFADRREFIVWFYSQQKDNLERKYPYLTKERAEVFAEDTAALVAERLQAFLIPHHAMNLVPSAFQKIANGTKTIELRLNDPKRQAICVGDHIVFRNIETDERLTVAVCARHEFPSFTALYHHLPLDRCGYTREEIPLARPEDMNAYYTDVQIKLHGVVGIEIQCL